MLRERTVSSSLGSYGKYFPRFLCGRKFTAKIGHAALRWMLSLIDSSSLLTRWTNRVSEFDYEALYKPGEKHVNADALSRNVNIIAVPFICSRLLVTNNNMSTPV